MLVEEDIRMPMAVSGFLLDRVSHAVGLILMFNWMEDEVGI